MNTGNQCIFANVNDQKIRGNLPVSHIRYSGVSIENWLPNLCVLKKKSSNELFAWSQSLNTFLHHQRKKWSFPLRNIQVNMKLRLVHHCYGYPSWSFSVCPGHAGRSCDCLIHDKKWSIFKNEDSTFQKASFMKLQIWLWMNLSFVYYH